MVSQHRQVQWIGIAIAALSGVALLIHARGFLPFMADDAFISLRYSERLLEGKGLTWTDGEVVEGYSNLLWVLGVAGVSRVFRLDLILAARVLGAAGMLATIAAAWFAFRTRVPSRLIALAAATASIALCGPVAVWAVGGLEQGLVAGLFAWALVITRDVSSRDRISHRRALIAGACLGLLCITRPDGPLLAATAGVAAAMGRGWRRDSVKLLGLLAVFPMAFTLGQILFRLAYYGDWVPNTAHAKISVTSERLTTGLAYLAGGTRAFPLLAVAGMVAFALLLTRKRTAVWLLLLPGLAWSCYLVVMGGDIFPAYRHLVVLSVLASLIVAEGIDWLVQHRGGLTSGPMALAATAALAFFPQRGNPEIERARQERWEWRSEAVGGVLRTTLGDLRPLLAADPAGCLPFFSKLPSLDMLGLNDRYLATHPPPGFGRGFLGHELGNGAYVLSRKPDLVFFCAVGTESPCFRSGLEMVALPEFARKYTQVRLQTPGPEVVEARIWIRTDGRLGPRKTPVGLVIPAHVLSSDTPLIAHQGGDSALWTTISSQPARYALPALAAGHWRMTAESHEPLLMRVSAGPVVAEKLGAVSLSLAASQSVLISLTAPLGRAIPVKELTLVREDLAPDR